MEEAVALDHAGILLEVGVHLSGLVFSESASGSMRAIGPVSFIRSTNGDEANPSGKHMIEHMIESDSKC